MLDNVQKRTILLVDDEPIITLSWKKRLEKYPYQVYTATNGEKAVAAVGAMDDIELVLMDIDLGNAMDGIESARQILAKKEIPIVFVSSHTEPEIIEKTEAVTSFGYIVKGSELAVYDASIKMAFKLFHEMKKTRKIEKILKTSLSSIGDAIFVADSAGNLIEFNSAFTAIQGFNSRSQCIENIDEYPRHFEVYRADGKFAELKDWALPRALNGETCKDEKYYIRRIANNDIWIGHYSFNPIRDEDESIIGGIVIIRKATDLYPDDPILDSLVQTHRRRTPS